MAERIAERRDERGSGAQTTGHRDEDDHFDHPSEDEAEVAWNEHEGMLEWGAISRLD